MPPARAHGYDNKVLDRYRKVWALAQQGEGGERTTAQSMVDKLREQHPGIHLQAFPPRVVPPPTPMDPFSFSQERLWEMLKGLGVQVQQGAQWAARAAYEAAQIELASDYADDLFDCWAQGDGDKWKVKLEVAGGVDVEALISGLTPVQQAVLADALAARVRDLLIEEFQTFEAPDDSDDWDYDV